jgi:hypothetical protein
VTQPAPKIAVKPVVEAEKIVAEPVVQAPRNIAAAPAPQMAEKTAALIVLPQPMRRSPQGATDQMLTAYRMTLASVGESQRAVASGVSAFALEMTDLAQATLTAACDGAAALAGARNFADAIEIQFGFAQRGFASLIAGSARLSEIGARLASEASRPIAAPLTGLARSD